MVAIKVARQVGRVSPAPAALPGETVTCVARLLLTEPALTTTHRGRNDSARRPVGVAVQLGPQTTTSANPSSSSRPRCLEGCGHGSELSHRLPLQDCTVSSSDTACRR